MPGTLTKTNGYKTTWGGKVTAKSTSFQKGQAQLSLLRAKEHSDWEPTGKPAKKYKKKKTAGGRARQMLTK